MHRRDLQMPHTALFALKLLPSEHSAFVAALDKSPRHRTAKHFNFLAA